MVGKREGSGRKGKKAQVWPTAKCEDCEDAIPKDKTGSRRTRAVDRSICRSTQGGPGRQGARHSREQHPQGPRAKGQGDPETTITLSRQHTRGCWSRGRASYVLCRWVKSGTDEESEELHVGMRCVYTYVLW